MSDNTWLTVNAARQELCTARHFKSNVEIQNSISFQGAVLKDIDNNASACNWSNVQPIRGPKQVTELQFGTTFLEGAKKKKKRLPEPMTDIDTGINVNGSGFHWQWNFGADFNIWC